MLKELNPLHHLRQNRRVTAVVVSAGLAAGVGVTGSTIGFDGSLAGRSGAITLGDGEAHRQATRRNTKTLGINNIGLNVSDESDNSTGRIGFLLNRRDDGSTYKIKIEKNSQAGENASSAVALPNFKELGYSPQSK